MQIDLGHLETGSQLPEHDCGPVTRTTLALFAGASGDHNPIHVDIDFAKKWGMDDVFAHGMLSMAYLAQLLTRWIPQERIRSYRVRFTSITPVHATVVCSGKVTALFEEGGEKRARLDIDARVQETGKRTLAGEAVIALD